MQVMNHFVLLEFISVYFGVLINVFLFSTVYITNYKKRQCCDQEKIFLDFMHEWERTFVIICGM